MTTGNPVDGRGDFDFIFGRWDIRNRKLVDVTDPSCTQWLEFDATSQVEPIFDGLGHVDRMFVPGQPGQEPFEGYTLRQFDPAANQWSIWWASSRQPGRLDPPLTGRWSDGVGTFYGDDLLDGRPVSLRFEWRADSPTAARWAQWFSWDAGSTWSVTWTMDFVRTG
jgi:hypothetical protein